MPAFSRNSLVLNYSVFFLYIYSKVLCRIKCQTVEGDSRAVDLRSTILENVTSVFVVVRAHNVQGAAKKRLANECLSP